MATTTTSTLVNNGPVRALGEGLNVARALFSWGKDATTTLSASVVVKMIPLPHGARVIDLIVKATFPGNTAGVFSVGDASDTDRYVTSASLTASSRVTRADNPAGFGHIISLSSSNINSYATIDVTFGAGATATFTACIDMTAFYIMDPSAVSG